MDFFHDIGLHKAMSFTRWRYGTGIDSVA